MKNIWKDVKCHKCVFQMRMWWDTEKDLLIQIVEMKMNPEEEVKRGQ